MIKHFPYQQLGKANHGWLKSNHHFSFAQYYHPKRMGFGTLRVVNDDWVAPNTGFASHPHKNMEIISFIRSGAITHKDSVGNKGVTPAGEVQVMSAGTGIVHSEYNRTKKPLTFYQIWIEPNKHNVKPRWESKPFSQQVNDDHLPLLVSGIAQDGEKHVTNKAITKVAKKVTKKAEKPLFIHQSARIYGGKIKAGASFVHQIEHQAYVLASSGEFSIADNRTNVHMSKGDGAEITQQKQLTITANTEAEIILIDAPK